MIAHDGRLRALRLRHQRIARIRSADGFRTSACLLEDHALPGFFRWGAVGLVLLIGALVVSGAHVPLARISSAQGIVHSTIPPTDVRHQEGGSVLEWFVADGDLVQPGDPILRLDTRSIEEERANLSRRSQVLAMDQERLTALLEGRVPEFDRLPGATVSTTAAQVTLFETRRSVHDDRRSFLEHRIALALAEIASHRRLLVAARRVDPMADAARGIVGRLAARSARWRTASIQADLALDGMRSETMRHDDEIRRLNIKIDETRAQLSELAVSSRAETQAELAAARREADELAQVIAGLAARNDHAVLLAPVGGIAMLDPVTMRRGTILPGAETIQILSLDTEMQIAAEDLPIGADGLRVGQPVTIRFPALDPAHWPRPLHDGVVAELSGMRDDNDRAIVMLVSSEGLRANGQRLRPGMAVEIEFVTTERSLLQSLLQPMRNLKARFQS